MSFRQNAINIWYNLKPYSCIGELRWFWHFMCLHWPAAKELSDTTLSISDSYLTAGKWRHIKCQNHWISPIHGAVENIVLYKSDKLVEIEHKWKATSMMDGPSGALFRFRNSNLEKSKTKNIINQFYFLRYSRWVLRF